jgi:integrase
MSKATKREITIEVVEALEPGGLVWDSDTTGFAVRCQKKAKIYSVKYRFLGRQRWYVIGKHGSPWTPRTARTEAKRLLGLVASDVDPAAAKKAKKEAPTVAEVVAQFLEEHASNLKPRTAGEYRRLFDTVILPALGRSKIAAVTRQDVAALHHSRKTTPGSANRMLALLSKLFNKAEAWGYRPDNSNPCRHVEKYPEQARDKMLSGEELARLGDALNAYSGSPYIPAAIKLLVFTGARLSEVLGLRWEQIDFERGEVRLAVHKTSRKTGAKTIHLPPPALAVLSELPRVEGNPFVIVGGVPGAALVNLEKPWLAIRKAAGLDDVRMHDLRHCFASVAASSGLGLPIIGKMLGHSQPQTTQRYAHLASDPVKAAAASVAGTIAAAMSGKPAAEVIDLPKRKA